MSVRPEILPSAPGGMLPGKRKMPPPCPRATFPRKMAITHMAITLAQLRSTNELQHSPPEDCSGAGCALMHHSRPADLLARSRQSPQPQGPGWTGEVPRAPRAAPAPRARRGTAPAAGATAAPRGWAAARQQPAWRRTICCRGGEWWRGVGTPPGLVEHHPGF